jgi:hypothetical protein
LVRGLAARSIGPSCSITAAACRTGRSVPGYAVGVRFCGSFWIDRKSTGTPAAAYALTNFTR